jgi:hypothetical protein
MAEVVRLGKLDQAALLVPGDGLRHGFARRNRHDLQAAEALERLQDFASLLSMKSGQGFGAEPSFGLNEDPVCRVARSRSRRAGRSRNLDGGVR